MATRCDWSGIILVDKDKEDLIDIFMRQKDNGKYKGSGTANRDRDKGNGPTRA